MSRYTFYYIGTPSFEKVTLNLENGKRFEISAPASISGSYRVKSLTLNGKPLHDFRLSHQQILNGGKIFFLYFNATIATLMVNILVYSDLRVATSPVFIATYCHLLPRPSKQRAEAEQFCPRPWTLIPTYTGFHTHVHGYGCP